ncbi:MAG: hypothetical protein GXO47_06385 [Chlorobi bacterium]|nr:hypothetical protein [Chlorobiota bacterium]
MIDRIRDTFINETVANLNNIIRKIESLKKGEDCRELVEVVYKTMHFIKGTAPMFGYSTLGDLVLPVEAAGKMLFESDKCFDDKQLKGINYVVALIMDLLTKSDYELHDIEKEKEKISVFF